jgi:hypothetical protein
LVITHIHPPLGDINVLSLKEVREAAAAEKKRLKDELTEEKRKAVEATA